LSSGAGNQRSSGANPCGIVATGFAGVTNCFAVDMRLRREEQRARMDVGESSFAAAVLS